MVKSRFLGLLVFLLLGLISAGSISAAAEEKQWIEVRSPHFRVLTDGSQKDARRVAFQFEQLRYVFTVLSPNYRLETGAPLTIFAARDEESAKKLEPGPWSRKGEKPAALFAHGWEKQYVVVQLDTFDSASPAIVYHEYAHSVLHANAHWLPTWLDEGLAEFYAYTRFEDHKIYVGAPTERSRTLLTGSFIPIETLLTVTQGSPYYHDPDKVQMFYAESWALVHFLIFGPEAKKGEQFDRFFALLQQRTDQKKAFEQVFGPLPAVDEALQQYIHRLTMTAATLPNPPKIDQKDFAARTLSIAETDAELAGLHLRSGNFTQARQLVDDALTHNPKLGLAHEEMGFLLFTDGKDAEAAAAFSQAITLDGSLYLSLFGKTMLSPIATSYLPADQAALHDALTGVGTLNPQFAPAYVQLARLSLRQNDLKSALALSKKAEELEPWRAGYHLLTGQILLRMGNGADAATFAEYVAERWPGPDRDEAVDLWNSIPASQRPANETLTRPPAKDIQSATGTVAAVTCLEPGQQFTFAVDDHGTRLTFHAKNNFSVGYSDTIWYGADHFSLCRHLIGMRSVVYYRPPSDGSYAGDVTTIEIRDDLPAVANRTDGNSQADKDPAPAGTESKP